MAPTPKTLEKLTAQEQEIFDGLAAGIDLTLERHPITPGKTGIFNFHLPSTITETHPILTSLLDYYKRNNYNPEVGYDKVLGQYELVMTVNK